MMGNSAVGLVFIHRSLVFVSGLCAAPLWSSKCAYVTTTGIRYSEMSSETQDAVVTRYFGIFFLIFQSGQIWGNLISSFVLQQGTGGNVFRGNANEVCGVNYCKPPTASIGDDEGSFKPDKSLVIKLLSIYLACGVFAILLIVVLLDRLTGNLSRKKLGASSVKLLIATMKHLRDRRMQLILPLTFFSGLEQAFIFGDYTAAFVTCSIGIHRVGFVMICFGVTDAVFSFSLGRITKYTGRVPVFISGLIVHVIAIITMLIWRPDAHLVWVFYVLAALQGYCDAVWQTQINALYGVFFPDNQEAAFSNYRLWESLGFVVAFAYATVLCIKVKLIILMIVLLVSMAMYFVAEYIHRQVEMQEYDLPAEEAVEQQEMKVQTGAGGENVCNVYD